LANTCSHAESRKEERRSFLKKRTKKLLFLGVLANATVAQAQSPAVQLLGPHKDFGYLVGDLLTTEAVITVPPGTTLDRQSLPIPGPLNAAIELRRIAAEQINQGQASEIRIQAEYQSFFAPEHVTQTELPGFTIRLTSGPSTTTAKIPAFAFQVSPLRVAQQSAIDLTELRPNHAVQPLPSQNLRRRLMVSVALALAAALTFAINQGWLPVRRGRNRPFAVAARHIGRQTGEARAETFQHLHRAFDATFGQKLFPGDLPAFISSHPHFAPAQAEISAFFTHSQSWFFAPGGQAENPSPNLAALAKKLRRLERQK
jgi:mxaA protein